VRCYGLRFSGLGDRTTRASNRNRNTGTLSVAEVGELQAQVEAAFFTIAMAVCSRRGSFRDPHLLVLQRGLGP